MSDASNSLQEIISNILLSVLHSISSEDDEIRMVALKLNSLLQEKIFQIMNDQVPEILGCLKQMINNSVSSSTVIYSLKWID